MRKIGIILLYASSVLMFVGGLGDQFISNFLDVHLDYLGNPGDSPLLKAAERLSLFLLHATGGGLMSGGVAMFALTHFGVRKNQAWAAWTCLAVALLGQSLNAYGMYSTGSYFAYPLVILVLAFIGFGLVMLNPKNEDMGTS